MGALLGAKILTVPASPFSPHLTRLKTLETRPISTT